MIPFFLSALLFLSALFSVFSPLPLLMFGVRKGRRWAWLAASTNSVLVCLGGGPVSLATYLVFVVASSLVILELLLRRKSIEKTAIYALLTMAIAGGIAIFAFSRFQHVRPWTEVQRSVSEFVDYLNQTMTTENANNGSAPSNTDSADLEEWKQNLITELPSAIAVIALILVWANLSILIRLNPQGLRERLGLRPDFLQHWKAPEWLIWPTIASGTTLLFDAGRLTDIGQNIFRFLMAVYAIQGLSILGFFFGLWRVRRSIRWLGYLISVLVLMPLLLSLGFFDLWFDFRSKFRQS